MAIHLNHTKKCCSLEKMRLMEELRKCDLCSTSYEEFQRCYSDTARESGRRARACIKS